MTITNPLATIFLEEKIWLTFFKSASLLSPVLEVILGQLTLSIIPIRLLRKSMKWVLVQIHGFWSCFTHCLIIFLIPAQTTLKILIIPQTFQAFDCVQLSVKAYHSILFALHLAVDSTFVFWGKLEYAENTEEELP